MQLNFDARLFRPATILVLDLVKHSTRQNLEIREIQSILNSVLKDSTEKLGLTDAKFSYSGDGYVITFAGESCARVIDFVNMVFPSLDDKLSPYNQQYRAGIDFGMIHFSTNPLTDNDEHFDSPGIVAARLESAANAGDVLCSENMFNLFSRHYPFVFSSELISITAKDRCLCAYKITPIDYSNIKKCLHDFIYTKPVKCPTPVGKRTKAMVIEDHALVRAGLLKLLRDEFDEHFIEEAEDAETALSNFEAGLYDFVTMDLALPGLDGFALTEILLKLDSDLKIVGLSAFDDHPTIEKLYSLGVSGFIPKSESGDRLLEKIRFILAANVLEAKRILDLIENNKKGIAFFYLSEISRLFRFIFFESNKSPSMASSLFRHKTGRVINEFLNLIVPGNYIEGLLASALRQLNYVCRIQRLVSHAKTFSLETFVRQYAVDMERVSGKIKFFVEINRCNRDISLLHEDLVALIIIELIDNALAAMETAPNGAISIEISELSAIRSLMINIKDTGPGVPESIRESMFIEGVSTKGSGRGVGLSLVKEAINSMKGNISYKFDGTSIFSVTIPI